MLPAISCKTTSGSNFPSAFFTQKAKKNPHRNDQHSGKSQRHFRRIQLKIIFILPHSNTNPLHHWSFEAAQLTHSVCWTSRTSGWMRCFICKGNNLLLTLAILLLLLSSSCRRWGNRLHLFQHWKAWPDVGSAHSQQILDAFSACTPWAAPEILTTQGNRKIFHSWAREEGTELNEALFRARSARSLQQGQFRNADKCVFHA